MLALIRLIAYVIDFIVLAVLLVSIQLMIYFATGGWMDQLQSGLAIEVWVLLTFSTPVWTYFIYCEYRKGQTLGKKLLNLKVESIDGQKIKLWQAVIRTGIKLLPWELTHLIILLPEPWWSHPEEPNYWIFIPNGLIVLYIFFLWWSKGNQALHDVAPGTRIARVRSL